MIIGILAQMWRHGKRASPYQHHPSINFNLVHYTPSVRVCKHKKRKRPGRDFQSLILSCLLDGVKHILIIASPIYGIQENRKNFLHIQTLYCLLDRLLDGRICCLLHHALQILDHLVRVIVTTSSAHIASSGVSAHCSAFSVLSAADLRRMSSGNSDTVRSDCLNS